MKLAQQQQAQHLYFQTDLNKTQIAAAVGVDRRTIATWSAENDWDRIKKSSQHMPSLIAEDLYVAMAHLTQSIISESREGKVITESEARTINRLGLTIGKLKNRSTLNENLEMLRFFMEFINDQDPDAVDIIQPLVNQYIAHRAKVDPWQFLAPKFNPNGYIPETTPNLTEMHLDLNEMLTPTPSQSSKMPESSTSTAPAADGRVPQQTAKQPTTTTTQQTPTPEQQAAHNAAVAQLEKYRIQLEKLSKQQSHTPIKTADKTAPSPTIRAAATPSTPSLPTREGAEGGKVERAGVRPTAEQPTATPNIDKVLVSGSAPSPEPALSTTEGETAGERSAPTTITADQPSISKHGRPSWVDFSTINHPNTTRAQRRKMFQDAKRASKQTLKTAA